MVKKITECCGFRWRHSCSVADVNVLHRFSLNNSWVSRQAVCHDMPWPDGLGAVSRKLELSFQGTLSFNYGRPRDSHGGSHKNIKAA